MLLRENDFYFQPCVRTGFRRRMACATGRRWASGRSRRWRRRATRTPSPRRRGGWSVSGCRPTGSSSVANNVFIHSQRENHQQLLQGTRTHYITFHYITLHFSHAYKGCEERRDLLGYQIIVEGHLVDVFGSTPCKRSNEAEITYAIHVYECVWPIR